MTWKILYDNGDTFDSSQGEAHEAPSEGYVCCVGYKSDNATRYIMHGWDFYHYDKESQQWWGHDIHGVLSRLRRNKPLYAFKQGATVECSVYKDLMSKAHRDPSFPQRKDK